MNSVTADDSASQTSAPSTTAPSTTAAAQPSQAVRLLSIEELADNEFDEYEVFDLTVYDTFEGSCNVVSQAMTATNVEDAPQSSTQYMSCRIFDMTYSDNDLEWTYAGLEPCFSVCTDSSQESHEHVRAIWSSPGTLVEIVLDSGADGSVLPSSFAHVGESDVDSRRSQYVDAQGKPIGVHDVRIAELRFGSVAFRERFVIANVTAPLISTGRLLKDGWTVCSQGDSTSLSLQKASHEIPLHFKINSLCAYGEIRMVQDVPRSTHLSGLEPKVTASLEHAVHVRVLTLGAALAALVPGWN